MPVSRFRGAPRCRAAFVVVGALVTFLFAATTFAADRFWVTPAGGAFAATPTHWSTTQGGASGASVPGVADIANFTLNTTYTVTFGQSATNPQLHVENGTVTFDLLGQTYTHTTATGTAVGNVAGQTARLTVTGGTMRSDTANDLVEIGAVNGATGYLTLSTAGRWIGNPDFVVGTAGDGFLTIQDGADVAASDSALGFSTGGFGNAIITDIGSTWTNTGQFTIGDAGDAMLLISNGAEASSATATIAFDPTGTGSVSVDGSGSRWSQSGALTIAEAGVGELQVHNRGRVSSGSAILGNAATGEGRVTISGWESTWSIAGTLAIGVDGRGTLELESSGQLSSGAANLGANPSGNGVVEVGDGSTWTANGAITIGAAGSGTMTVSNTGSVTTTAALNINDPSGSAIGTLNLAGGSITAQSVERAGNLNWADGTLTVVGGNFNNGGANLTINGQAADDRPTLHLAAGATGTNFGATTLTIGGSQQGAATVTGGSTLSVAEARVGSFDGGTGFLVIRGTGSEFVTTSDLSVGGIATAGGGAGFVHIHDAGQVRVGGALRLWPEATVSIDGGTLRLANLDPRGGKVAFQSGRIQFASNQTLGQSDGVADAILGPQHILASGQTLEAAGPSLTLATNLTLDGGRLEGNTLVVAGPGELRLMNPTSRIDNATLRNQGIVSGSGRIGGTLENEATGQIRAASGERLVFAGGGNHLNNGLIDVAGGAVEFTGPARNNGQNPATGAIAGRDGVLRFHGGLTNSGSMVFSNGTMDIFGDINNVASNPTTGRIIVSGGGTANFYDDVVNSGTIQVSAAGNLQSTAVFFGALSGNGVAGTGHVFIEGDARPGFSPGTMAFGGNVSFSPAATLDIEIGGAAPGTQYDRVAVADSVALAGDIEITLVNGFVPAPGQQFTVMTYGSRTGEFGAVRSPTAPGLSWTASYGPTSLTLTVGGLAGDMNSDGSVDALDLSLFARHFGTQSQASVQQGDFNGDGRTSLADLVILRNNFSGGLPIAQVAQPVPVPEPAMVVLVGLVLSIGLFQVHFRAAAMASSPRLPS